MTGGVYLAFDGGPDASGPGGTGLGPYDEIVLRGARAVGEREGLGKVIALRSAAGSWRDAESSSSGSDQVETGRGDLRISGGDGAIVLRFADDEVAGHTAVPDLGRVIAPPYDAISREEEERLLARDDASLAVGLGAFGLAVAANIHAQRSGSTHQGALALALVAWPLLTAVPAFVVALGAATLLSLRRRGV